MMQGVVWMCGACETSHRGSLVGHVSAMLVPALMQHLLLPCPSLPRFPGVYLHGSVGSGKTLVMDLLSSAVHAEHTVPLHRRLHFNSAMLELHRWVGGRAVGGWAGLGFHEMWPGSSTASAGGPRAACAI